MRDTSTDTASTNIKSAKNRRAVIRGPLTFQQLFLWDYFNLKNNERPRDTHVFRVVGSLNRDLLARSINEVTRRHDCLRTRIVMMDGILEQHVDEPVELDLEVIELENLSQNDRGIQARDFIDQFTKRKCNLAVGPSMDTALIRMTTDEHLFTWSIHHVISDATTCGIVLGEIWLLYNELLQGRQPHIARAPILYLDYAHWQHKTHDEWLQKHERYWKDRITSATCVHWPSVAHIADDEHANAWFEVNLSMPPLAALHAMARFVRTTPAMVMLAVYAAAVASWCKQSVCTIPVNLAGRHRPEHEHAAGYFAQFLYVNVEINLNKTFLELLTAVSNEFRGALIHQDFGKVAAQVPDVVLGSLFSWISWKGDALGFPPSAISNTIGITIRPFSFTRPPTRIAFRGIGVFFFESEGEYTTRLWYRTDVFSKNTVERFATELQRLCKRVIAAPQCLLAETWN